MHVLYLLNKSICNESIKNALWGYLGNAMTIPPSHWGEVSGQQVPVCSVVKCQGHDRSQISRQSNSGICHLVLQQINDNYPTDMNTVITLQDQEQGEREKERMKGCGPHLARSWSILCEIWLWPAPRPSLIAAQQAIPAFLHRAATEPGFVCASVCVWVWFGSSHISINLVKCHYNQSYRIDECLKMIILMLIWQHQWFTGFW